MIPTSKTPSKKCHTFVWQFGVKFCQKYVIFAFLITWLVLFMFYSNRPDGKYSIIKKQPDFYLPRVSNENGPSTTHRVPLPWFPKESENTITNLIPSTSKETVTSATIPESSTTILATLSKNPIIEKKQDDDFNPKQKSILFFTSYFDMPDFQFGFGHKPFADNCPVNNCFATNNRSIMAFHDYDAVVFHIRDMGNGKIPVPNQKHRTPKQRYLMFLMESPLNDDFPYEKFGGFFNWTMTYRLDSDFVRPYSWVEPLSVTPARPPTASQLYNLTYTQGNVTFLNEKTMEFKTLKTPRKLVSWMVSNCNTHSQREHFVEQLQLHVSVDIYGECGPLKCARSDESGCLKMLETNYKFYLSFENSLCEDYITEKFFKVLSYNMVPVVLGGGNYSKIAPNKSYIDAKDFQSIGHLAEYLKYLDKNETAYAEYFEWKRHFRVVTQHMTPFCQLCQALNNPEEPPKIYQDIHKWWRKDAHCIKKGRFPWSPSVLETYVDYFRQSASQIASLIPAIIKH